MILHQDALRFVWLPGDDRQYDPVVTLDDVTSAIYSAFLVEEEGVLSSFRSIGEVIDKYGLFCELSTHRGGHYFHTPKAGEPVSWRMRTQVGRALANSVFAISRAVRPRGGAWPRSWPWSASPRSRRSSARPRDG
jgi:hypothetical protein